jgi:parallel beta-helix repeat protein
LVTGDIQQAIDANPEGTIFCLSGTYGLSQPLRPKTGQSFVGPAIIVAQNGTTSAFTLKDAKAQGVTLVDLDVSGFSDSGIQLWVGTTVIRGRYHHNTTNGMGGGFEYALGAVTLDGVEVDHNGDAALLGISSGGIKIARLADLFLVQNCNIHDNLGNGVWADVQCIGDYRIINNTVSNNSRKGIHYEKSGASDEFQDWGVVCKGCGLPVVEGTHYVAGNTVTGNGWENRAHAADGGIVGVSSRNMVIENNTTSGNHRAGIMLYQDDRLAGEQHGWIVGATVRNNITPDGIIGCDLPGVTCS